MANIPTTSNAFLADLRRAYRAEFDRSPEIKAEFIEAADYAAFKVTESPDLIRRMCENYEATLNEAVRQRAIRAGLLHARH